MTKYARILNNIVVDISDNPSEQFHPDLVDQFQQVPDEVEFGWQLISNVWTAPELAEEIKTWSIENIRNGLTLSEKVKWDNDSAPEIVTAKQEMNSPKELEAVTEILQMLVDASVISQTSMDKILV